jgi:hypothetical protein
VDLQFPLHLTCSVSMIRPPRLTISTLSTSCPSSIYREGTIYKSRSSKRNRVGSTRRVRQTVTELTAGDITRAYATIGYTEDHTVLICVSPQESPDEYILTMHKQAMKNAKSPADRSAVSEAITIIGTSRNNEIMKEYGRTGQTMITVEDAYRWSLWMMDSSCGSWCLWSVLCRS